MQNNQTLNVEDIIMQIKEEIRNKNIICEIPEFKDIIIKDAGVNGNQDILEMENNYLKQNCYLSNHRIIISNNKKISYLIMFIKKVIRKLTKFYIEPLALEQSEYNAHTSHLIDELIINIRIQEKQIELLKNEIEIINKQN